MPDLTPRERLIETVKEACAKASCSHCRLGRHVERREIFGDDLNWWHCLGPTKYDNSGDLVYDKCYAAAIRSLDLSALPAAEGDGDHGLTGGGYVPPAPIDMQAAADELERRSAPPPQSRESETPEAIRQPSQHCACLFQWRPMPDFSSAPPVLLEECGYHTRQRERVAALARERDNYREKADALLRYSEAKKDEAMLAVVSELINDALKRKAISSPGGRA